MSEKNITLDKKLPSSKMKIALSGLAVLTMFAAIAPDSCTGCDYTPKDEVIKEIPAEDYNSPVKYFTE